MNLSHKLPKKFKVPPGYVLVQVFEEEAISSMGMKLPASDQDKYNMWVKVRRVGGNWARRIWVYFTLGYQAGDEVRIKKNIDHPFIEGDDKLLVVFQEDVNLIK